MDFAPDERTLELTEHARAFLDEHVLPVEGTTLERDSRCEPRRRLCALAHSSARRGAEGKGQGRGALEPVHARSPKLGAGLSTLEYAPVAEEIGKSSFLVRLCSSAGPRTDTGNIEVPPSTARRRRRKRWLTPPPTHQ